MNIIEQARDALDNKTPADHHARQYAAAVDRAAKLADELEASWRDAPVIDGFKSSGAGMALHAALGIRAALEGAEEWATD